MNKNSTTMTKEELLPSTPEQKRSNEERKRSMID